VPKTSCAVTGLPIKTLPEHGFYLRHIGQVPDFNKARSEKYGEFGIMPGPGDATLLLPASTGIGADTPSGAAASMDLLAVVENDDIPSTVINSPTGNSSTPSATGAAFRGVLSSEKTM